jgi:predicted Holliday junction resolvase-like endonuclease
MDANFIKEIWVQAGALGLLIFLLILTVYITWKQIKFLQEKNDIRLKEVSEVHKKERESWREESNALIEKVLIVVNENTNVLSELTTLVKRLNGK